MLNTIIFKRYYAHITIRIQRLNRYIIIIFKRIAIRHSADPFVPGYAHRIKTAPHTTRCCHGLSGRIEMSLTE